MVRGQSILKLYVIFNMLDVFERLLLSFGQDTLDSLYGLTVSRFCQNKISGKRKGKTLTLLFYFVVAIIYICILVIQYALCLMIYTIHLFTYLIQGCMQNLGPEVALGGTKSILGGKANSPTFPSLCSPAYVYVLYMCILHTYFTDIFMYIHWPLRALVFCCSLTQ